MSFTHRVGQTYASNNGTVSSVTTQLVGDGEVAIDVTVPPATTDLLIDLDLTIARVKSFVIYSSQAVTVDTNSTTTPGNTLTIPAGGSVLWHNGAAYTNPLTVDVTALYVTNSGSTAASFKLTALVDATP